MFNVAKCGLPFLRSRAVAILRHRIQLQANNLVLSIWAAYSPRWALSPMMNRLPIIDPGGCSKIIPAAEKT
jgi:hypothetical protein